MKGSWNRFKKVRNGSEYPPPHEAGPRRPPLSRNASSRATPAQNGPVVESLSVAPDESGAQSAPGVNERIALVDASSYLDIPEAADSPASAEGSPGHSGPQTTPKGPRISVRLPGGGDWLGWVCS